MSRIHQANFFSASALLRHGLFSDQGFRPACAAMGWLLFRLLRNVRLSPLSNGRGQQ